VATTVIAAPVANVDFVGLAGATDILVYGVGITMSASDVPILRVSTNNGVSYFSTSGDYIRITPNGVASNATNGCSLWGATASAARSGGAFIVGANIVGAPRFFMAHPNDSSPGGLFLADNANPINAIRLVGNAAANLTGGTFYVLTR
jgi:hypothetical protein